MTYRDVVKLVRALGDNRDASSRADRRNIARLGLGLGHVSASDDRETGESENRASRSMNARCDGIARHW